MGLQKTQLKRGLFSNPLHANHVEKYVIEDRTDLNKFFKAFPILRDFKSMAKGYIESIEDGKIVIADDPHPSHGLNTYCHETIDRTCKHPSSYIRVKLVS